MYHFNRSKIQPIGLDIGHDAVKLLQVEVASTGNTLSVVAAAQGTLPFDVRQDHGLRLATSVQLVKRLLRQQPFHGNQVVASLPREFVHVKNLRLPAMPPAELAAAINFEAPNIFPFNVEKARIQYLPAGEVRQGNDTRQEVIIFAVKDEDAAHYLELLHRAGVCVLSLDIEPCALFRTVDRYIRRREDEQQVTVLVDIGWRRSQVVIGRGRDINFVKSVDIGGKQLQDAIAHKLSITVDEARALRQRLIESHIPVDSPNIRRDPVRQAVVDATRASMEELGREINLCLRYYSVAFRGQRPAKLRLLGGESRDPQICATLAAVLPIPVEPGQPLFNVDTSRMRSADRVGTMPEWGLSFGLGLKLVPGPFAPLDGAKRTSPPPVPVIETISTGAQVVDPDELIRSFAVPPETVEAGRA